MWSRCRRPREPATAEDIDFFLERLPGAFAEAAKDSGGQAPASTLPERLAARVAARAEPCRAELRN
jgi:hypothetical protein